MTPRNAARGKIALIAVLLFIVYGSLYPFRFVITEYPRGPVHALLETWGERGYTGDMLANVVLYAPFGFCAFLCCRGPRAVRALAAIAAATILSCCMEFLQLYDEGRWAAMSDVRANVMGAVVGALVALVFELMPRRARRLPLGAYDPFALLILSSWLAYRLFPYVPVIDLHKYWHAVRPLLSPTVSALAFCNSAVTWAAVAFLLAHVSGERLGRWTPPALFSVVLFGRILIVGTSLSPSEVAGGGLSMLLWTLRPAGSTRFAGALAAAFALNLAAQGLAPFHFQAAARPFSWVPFYSFIEGDPFIAVPAFFQKTFTFGAFLWLMLRAGTAEGKAALMGMTLVAAITVAHLYLPGRSAEITDCALFLCIAGVRRLLALSSEGAPRPRTRSAPGLNASR